MKRQAMSVNLAELTELRDQLITQQMDLQQELKLDKPIDYNQKFMIGIINKTPECCDTWEIEI
jgi:division protein CdvB (Snf7/Vps24/ESCRT-III family)